MWQKIHLNSLKQGSFHFIIMRLFGFNCVGITVIIFLPEQK